jgi:putative ABC transport system substrate-binding protein
LDAFLLGLQELGYSEGRNIIIEWRFADGDYSRLPAQAESLVRANVEIIVTTNLPSTLAAQKATRAIPIVFSSLLDPVGAGVVSSLSHPDNNTTGRSLMSNETAPKQIELLRLVLPNLRSVAVLTNPGVSIHRKFVQSLAMAGKAVNVDISVLDAKDVADVDRSISQMSQRRMGALVIPTDAFFNGQRHHIAELALAYRLPTIFPFAHDVESGGLLSYGPDLVDYYRKTAIDVGRILKGAKPEDLPIEQPLTFYLGINLRTARLLGLEIPKELQLRADQLVE